MIKNKTFAIITLMVFIIEVLIATVFKKTVLRPVFGDFLVVILIYAFFKAITHWKPLHIGIGVLAFSYLIEFSQRIHILDKLSIKPNKATELLLGSSFDWYDVLAYTLGVVCIVLIDLKIMRKVVV